MLAGPNMPQGPNTLAGRSTLEAAQQATDEGQSSLGTAQQATDEG